MINHGGKIICKPLGLIMRKTLIKFNVQYFFEKF